MRILTHFLCMLFIAILMPVFLAAEENRENPASDSGTFVLAIPRNAQFAIETANALKKTPKSPIKIDIVLPK